MPEILTDHQLIDRYLAGSQRAFTELAHRHAGLVYSAALRQTANPHLSQDITQAVFILLAKKAHKFGARIVVSGWLYRTARYAAQDAMKTERRRRYHEQQAAIAIDSSTNAPQEDAWQEISPMLDTAMASLRETDRVAVVLRFFENKSLRDIGRALGINEAAAGRRTDRAIERLRRYFAQHGVSMPAAVLATAITKHAITHAPSTAIVAAAAAPICLATSNSSHIANGAWKTILFNQAKIPATIILAALVTTATIAIVIQSGARADSAALPRTSPTSTVPAAQSPGSLHVELPGGEKVELLCLSATGPNGDQTWAPDGTTIETPSVEMVINEKNYELPPGQRLVRFAIAATNPDGSALNYNISTTGTGTEFGISGEVIRNDVPLQNAIAWVIAEDSQTTELTIDLGLAAGPWQKIATWSSPSKVEMTTTDKHYTIVPGLPAVRDGQLIIPVTFSLPKVFNWHERLFAVLKNGIRRKADSQNSSTHIKGTDVFVTDWSFDRAKPLNPDDVDHYELQALRSTQVSLKNISLFPDHQTHPATHIVPPTEK